MGFFFPFYTPYFGLNSPNSPIRPEWPEWPEWPDGLHSPKSPDSPHKPGQAQAKLPADLQIPRQQINVHDTVPTGIRDRYLNGVQYIGSYCTLSTTVRRVQLQRSPLQSVRLDFSTYLPVQQIAWRINQKHFGTTTEESTTYIVVPVNRELYRNVDQEYRLENKSAKR